MAAAVEVQMKLNWFEPRLTRRSWLPQGSLMPGTLIATHQKEL